MGIVIYYFIKKLMNKINEILEQIKLNPVGSRISIITENKNYLIIKNGSNNFTYYNNIESMVVSFRLLLKLLSYNFIKKMVINKPCKQNKIPNKKRSNSI